MFGWKKKKTLAWEVSHYVAGGLDPVIVLPVMVIWLLWWFRLQLMSSWLTCGLLFVCYVVLPGLGFYWLYATKRVNDLDVSDWKLRFRVYLVFLASHTLGVIVAGWLGAGDLFWVLLGLWGLLVSFTILNHLTKVSLHVGTLATFVTLLVWLINPRFAILYGLVFLMGWVRVYQRHHTLTQVLLGGLVPVGVLSLVLRWIVF